MPMLLLDGGEEQAARALCLNRPDDILFSFAALREATFTNAHLLCDRTIIYLSQLLSAKLVNTFIKSKFREGEWRGFFI